ncbi:E3 ubiquitin-protein ligase HTD3 [Phytophthora boehmeriae]|uniref:E3 ubiquitin-protein ligase HTD3 n=1 Tax=Phytophthora boehmeriae TaxID=109152 RepID=A0A8T1WYI1_9STRA|nr:E3 ubiquitin-protein ligase HTD3 [Phytophthora boehmeriae]
MSDPFDFLNPIASTKTPAEKVLGQPHSTPVGVVPAPVAPLNIGMGMPHSNLGMGMGAPPAFNGGMHMGMGPNGGGMMPGQFPGGGMGHGMNQPNPFGQPQQQQSPVMYDNIKKLLEKKPVVDDASMDFLEGLGGGSKVSTNPAFGEPTTRAPEPTAPVNPFQSSPAYASTELDFNFLGGGAPSTTSPITQPSSPASTGKSSALASRLAQGKRPTQEAARKNLGFNAGAFAGTGNTAKISLKSVSGGSTSSSAHEPTLDDFASGNASLAPMDDFAPAPPKPAETAANDIFW